MAGWQISQGKACNLHPIYPPHLLLHLPGDYWALDLLASLPRCSCLYAVAVRRAGTLPTASFRFHLAVDTLAVQLTVPITRVCRGLSPPSHSVKHHIRPSCVYALHAMPGTPKKRPERSLPAFEILENLDCFSYLLMSRFTSCSGPTQRTAGRAMSCMWKHPSHGPHLLFLLIF
jgi:hypothetical protein